MTNKRLLAAILTSMIVALSACGANSDTSKRTMPIDMDISTAGGSISAESQEAVDEKAQKKKNSVMMLNYLRYISYKIDAVQYNKLLLDEIAKSLRSDIKPNAIDETTQNYLKEMLDTIQTYSLNDTRRSRLQYLYEQKRARAIKQAIREHSDSFMYELASAVNMDMIALLGSGAINTTGAIIQMEDEISELKLEYLQEGWELDDVASQALHESRKNAFDYLITYVHEENISDEYTISEKDMELFAERMEQSAAQRLIFLEANKSTYGMFEFYWLELVDCYFELQDYEKCIVTIQAYEEVKGDIFAKDERLAKSLPGVIVAASKVMEEQEYIVTAEKYLKGITDNIYDNEWEMKYFVSEAYVDLYKRTAKPEYLQEAYEIVKTNIGYLVEEQKKINDDYIEEVKLIEILEGFVKEEKIVIKEYNQFRSDQRKTELPSAYEPLVVNCELLFYLADELNISESEKQLIESALRPDGDRLFLTSYLEERYSFSAHSESDAISFEKDEINISTSALSSGASIKVTVVTGGDTAIYDDWEIKKVDRKNGSYGIYTAIFTSSAIKEQKWAANSEVKIEVFDLIDSSKAMETFRFRVSEYKEIFGVTLMVEFEEY